MDGLTASGGSADTRFVYDTLTGKLFFDPDGTGADSSRLIAVLSGHPVLDASDFTIL